MAACLNQLGHVKKYCLLNARFISPALYHDSSFLDKILESLSYLVKTSHISGIVFSDFFLLTALSNREHAAIHSLEAIPSINLMIDSAPKAVSMLEAIHQTGFKPPAKIILDRSLNRDMEQLEKTCLQLKKFYPDIKIELLANEGCISHCPFKSAHDAIISHINTTNTPDITHRMNQEHGCKSYFIKNPEFFFKSPFIRPEDIHHYKPFANSIKICGRTLGPKFLKATIGAYLNESYSGNLLQLMDACHWLSDIYHIHNKRLDPNFLKMVTTYTKENKNSMVWVDLFKKNSKKLPLTIKNFKDCQ